MTEPILSVENLCFSYGAQPVLKDVHFTIEKGEWIGIFGPNGGGKTTLLHLLMGFIKPTRGKITILNRKPGDLSLPIGWVPQSFQYDSSFPITARQVVLMGLLSHIPWHGRFKKEEIKKADEALDQLDMLSFTAHPFHALSGGQIQRVLIARALVGNPALLLLDEPTSSVDQSTFQKIAALLESIKRKITIVMVTHELSFAINQVDRFFCVQRTLTEFPTEKVCEHFALGLYHPPLASKGGPK